MQYGITNNSRMQYIYYVYANQYIWLLIARKAEDTTHIYCVAEEKLARYVLPLKSNGDKTSVNTAITISSKVSRSYLIRS